MTNFEPTPRRRGRVWSTAAGVAVVLFLVVASFQLGASTTGAAIPAAESGGDSSELEPVVELFDELRDEAVNAPAADELVESAMEGMLGSLEDPYAHFYDEQSYAELNQVLGGQFSGVGLVLEDRTEGPVIVSVIEGAPAGEAGISAGERIVEVDGEDVSGATIEQLVGMVKGEAGTDVELTLDGGERGRYTVTVTRADIELPQIESRLLDDGAGYIRLLQFTDQVGQDLRQTASDLIDQGAEGIVLDLRGNPGGLLDEAVEVASVFIGDGPIVSVQERAGDRQTFDATGDALDVPLVVLVDGGSASASEIVAGAVKDRGRGEIVGEQTFGKGTVQTIRSLPDGLGVKFTTARYFTPSGDSIEEMGVTPDRVVADEDEQLAAAQAALDAQVAQAAAR
jgi:carboxyl-terminal processing protease